MIYVTNKITGSPAGHQLPTYLKNVWIIDINGEEHITYQGTLDELNQHQNPRGKSKFKISICISKSYQREDIEDICYRFIKSHLRFHILKFVSQKNLSPKRKSVKL